MEPKEFDGILNSEVGELKGVKIIHNDPLPTNDVLPALVIGHILRKLVCQVPLDNTDLWAIQAMPSEEIDKHDWLMVLAGAEEVKPGLDELAREELFIELGHTINGESPDGIFSSDLP